jgi:uncharacterized 2Fe-2S/4Fe-4S cluster protein (DUF4445 family)
MMKIGDIDLDTVNVVVQPFGRIMETTKGQTLYDVFLEAGIDVTSICGGSGKCGKCRVIVSDPGFKITGGPTDVEMKSLSVEELSRGTRLACQVEVQGDVEVYVPRESLNTRVRLQTEGIETDVAPLPLVKKYHVELPEPTLQDVEPDLERLLKAMSESETHSYSVSPGLLRNLSEELRGANWEVTATVWDRREIIHIEKGDTAQHCYGLAVDLGTTKLASYLVNLATGETVATSSMVNPQVPHGEDVMTRIQYAMKGEKERDEIQGKIVDGINQLIAECCTKGVVEPHHVYEATMVGNTAMHHLLLGINPTYLAHSPYVPAVRGSLNVKAKELNLGINPRANVHFLPLIAGFVGSDCVANILAAGLFDGEDHRLLLDIGTNTEVVIGNKDRLLTCSCASGPAFEGAHIKHGMKASSGAIEGVKIDPDNLDVFLKTIDDVEPKGLCGSGIVDAVAEMLKAGIINKEGTIRFEFDSPKVRKNDSGEREFVVVRAGEGSPRDIVVTQRDIREIQLAKGAIRTGINILLKEVGVGPEQIKRTYLAGAFGTYINSTSAKAIGMIPDFPPTIITSIGNAAGTGARMALTSGRAREMCEKISRNVEYVELGAHPDFQSVFIESLNFPPP